MTEMNEEPKTDKKTVVQTGHRVAIYLANNTTSFGKDMSIELQSDNEDTKTLLSYAEAFIEKHRSDNNG